MQHFSNYFVKILVIRSKCERVTDGLEGERGAKKLQGAAALLPLTFRVYELSHT